MADKFYPSVDIEFIKDQVIQSGKLADDGIFKIGTTTTFIAKGQQAIFKRSTSVRELEPGMICFEQATGLALRYSFMKELVGWLEKHKNWKEGAYVVAKEDKNP